MPTKICPKCNEKVGVRTKQCPSCNSKFVKVFNPKKTSTEEINDWTELKPGDTIKSLQGYGPKRLVGDEEVYMGNYGIFTVLNLDLLGIHARGEEGHVYLYMGEDKLSATGTLMSSHKIKKVQSPR